jgi:uncharacterized membrane protein
MTSFRRSRTLLVGGFVLYFTLLWFLWETPVVYPIKLFVIFLHEISHGVASIATGGSIQGITLDPRLGGACYCPGGNAFLTLSAGYIGSLIWGGIILEGGRKMGRKSPIMVRMMGVFILVLTLLYLRGVFTVTFGVAVGVGLVLAARYLSGETNRILLSVLGMTSCLYAILDIKSDVLDRPHLPSDAHMLFELTGVQTVYWGGIWIAIALAISGWLFVRMIQSA